MYDVRLHAGAGATSVVSRWAISPGRACPQRRTCGDMRADIGVLGHVGIFRTKLAQLFGQHVGKVKLNGARGYLVAVCILGLRVDLDVAQKALEDIGLVVVFSIKTAPILVVVCNKNSSTVCHGIPRRLDGVESAIECRRDGRSWIRQIARANYI